MNRADKLKRVIELADELNSLMQELAMGMNVTPQDVKYRHDILEDIKEDAESTLDSINFWTKEEK